jgi:hypothetical protein
MSLWGSWGLGSKQEIALVNPCPQVPYMDIFKNTLYMYIQYIFCLSIFTLTPWTSPTLDFSVKPTQVHSTFYTPLQH